MKIITRISKESLYQGISILLLFIAISSGAFTGGVTKSAIIISMVLNIIYFPRKNKIVLMLLFSAYMFLTIFIDSAGGVSDTSFVVLIFILWFISIPKHYDGYFNIIKMSVVLSFFVGCLLSLFDILFLKNSNPFTYNMAQKGLAFVDAFIGLSNIPQTFGILGIITFVLLQPSNKKLSFLSLALANLALNRVTFILSVVSMFRKKILIYISMFFVLLVYLILTVESESLFATHSLTNRVGLTLGIWNQYIHGSFLDILIGVKTKPEVFYISSTGGVDYIENGYMFLLYYYGLIGAASYIFFFFFWIVLVPLLYKMKTQKLDLYIALLYFFVVPLFTHEIAHINFYIMMYILYYRLYKSRTSSVEYFAR